VGVRSSIGAGAGSAGFSVVVLGLRLRPAAPGRRRLAFCCLGPGCSCVSCTAATSGAAVVDTGSGSCSLIAAGL